MAHPFTSNWSSLGWSMGFIGLAHTGHRCGPHRMSRGHEYVLHGQVLNTIVTETYDLSFWIAEAGGSESGIRIVSTVVTVANFLNPSNSSCVTGPPTFQWECDWLQIVSSVCMLFS